MTPMNPGRIERITVAGPALRGNALGDPSVRELPVYLPPGYDESEERYPVIWNLTGFTGYGAMQLNRAAWSEAVDQRLDRLIGSGACPPVIMALPDCFTRLGGSQYLDSSATGNYETHLCSELIPAVDDAFRTLAEPAHRGVMGKSSGGYGAIVQGMRHPELYGAVACHSGDMAFEHCYLPDFFAVVRAVDRFGSLEAFLEDFEAAPKKTHQHHQVINVLAMASCYTPNPEKAAPFAFDLPFNLETGAIDLVVWERWLDWDPVRMAPQHAEALKGMKLLFIDCGRQDEWRLDIGARILCAKLRELDVEHEHEEFDDGHRSITYRYDVSIPKMAKALAAE
jgi:enterochelin esterase family protein